MEKYPVYAGGEFRLTDGLIPVVNPFHGDVFALAGQGGQEDLEFAISRAMAVKEEMTDLPSHRKYSILMQIAEEMTREKDLFTRLISLEAGKPWRYSAAEVDRAIQTFIVGAEESRRLPKEFVSLDWTEAGEGKEGLVKYFPVGLVGGIAPFNFPLNLAVHKIAPALAAGCPIILKPASSTPLSTLELAKIIDKTSLPKGAVSILPMNRDTGEKMATDPRIRLLSFTGSPEVGWKLKKLAWYKKVVLELGGNAGVIVTGTADLGLALRKCLAGAFAYSGQVCIHTQRIYVHDSLFDDFAKHFCNAAGKLKAGDPLDPETEISSMIDEENAARVEAWVQEGCAQGARILCGGKREGTFYPPTVMTDTKREMKVCSGEIFGPVVILEKYSEFEKAIEEINAGPYGLQAGVFTDSSRETELAFRKLEVGGVVVNDVPTFRVDHMPYGGVKNSGMGREGVRYAILSMTEARLLVKNF